MLATDWRLSQTRCTTTVWTRGSYTVPSEKYSFRAKPMLQIARPSNVILKKSNILVLLSFSNISPNFLQEIHRLSPNELPLYFVNFLLLKKTNLSLSIYIYLDIHVRPKVLIKNKVHWTCFVYIWIIKYTFLFSCSAVHNPWWWLQYKEKLNCKPHNPSQTCFVNFRWYIQCTICPIYFSHFVHILPLGTNWKCFFSMFDNHTQFKNLPLVSNSTHTTPCSPACNYLIDSCILVFFLFFNVHVCLCTRFISVCALAGMHRCVRERAFGWLCFGHVF